MLWTEKYRPNKLSDVIGQTDFVLDAEHWVENRNMPNVLLFGPPGVGKTQLGQILGDIYYNLGILKGNNSKKRDRFWFLNL